MAESSEIDFMFSMAFQSQQMLVRSLCGLLLVLSVISSSLAEEASYRLPRNVKPEHYDLFLKFDLPGEAFSGNVTISVKVEDSSPSVVLHARKLKILSTKIFSSDHEVKVDSVQENKKVEQLVVTPSSPLAPGEYLLTFEFEEDRSVKENIYQGKGLYRGSYMMDDQNAEERVVIALFQPTEARSIFPCFDEPDLKATFSVVFQHPKEYHALSNMDVKDVRELDSDAVTSFKKSVPMSTYALGIVVSKYGSRSVVVDTHGIGEPFEMRFHIRSDLVDNVVPDLELAKKMTEYYIQYFNISYPLPKLDWVAVPANIKGGALENWGLIAIQERCYKKSTKSYGCSDIARGITIAHELAHMWFGNLVTMRWWNDLWLNEAFATFMSYETFKKSNSDQKQIEYARWMRTERSFQEDALADSKTVVGEIKTSDDIELRFHGLTYAKGAAIVRMLENYLGSDGFKAAITSFLNKYKFGSADTIELINELELWNQFPGFSIREFVTTWTEQTGYPIINIEKVYPGVYKLTQKQFLMGIDGIKEGNSTWTLPISYITGGAPPNVTWINKDESERTLFVEGASWIKLNKDRLGFFRVNYSREMWYELADALTNDASELGTFDRYNLLNDAWTLSLFSKLDFDVVLELMKFLARDTDPILWNQVVQIFEQIEYWAEADDWAKLQEFGRHIVKNVYDKNKAESESEDFSSTIKRFACSVDYEDCVQEAKEKFSQWIENPPYPNESRLERYVGKTAVRNSESQEIFPKLWDLYEKYHERDILSYMAASNDHTALENLLLRMRNTTQLSKKDFYKVLEDMTLSKPDFLWNFLVENWEEARKDAPSFMLWETLEGLLTYSKRDERLPVLKRFIETIPSNEERENIRKWILMKFNVRLTKYEPITKWLQANSNSW